jgi:hypothetical protein
VNGAALRSTAIASACGVAIGAVYTLSPLTVLTAVGVAALGRAAVRNISGAERQWLIAILGGAMVLRVLVVVALFLSADPFARPFRTLFGDEEAFLLRAVWRRNIALGIPIHRADFIYAFDQASRTSYVDLMAVLQGLVGPSPYALHLVSILCFMLATVILYRLVRRAFGWLPALLGLAVLLYLPSLFAWSVSTLKEPLYGLVLCVGLAAAVAAGRASGWSVRIGGLFVILLTAIAAQTIREGGFLMASVGGGGGLACGVAAQRPRRAVAGAVAACAIAAVLLSRGAVEDRIVTEVRRAAEFQWLVVNTPGNVYPILGDDFYADHAAIRRMTLRQGTQYVVNALVRYVTVPTPWQIRSRAALLFLPEQMVWLVMVLLLPLGVVAALRRDPMLTAVLLAYAAAAALVVSLTSGNIGTLVRHRGLAIPYLVWFSALGGCDLLTRWSRPLQEVDVDRG